MKYQFGEAMNFRRCPDFGGNSLERIQDGWNINSLTQLLGQATVV
jgi:hypothetical protein